MAETEEITTDGQTKRSKIPVILVLVLTLIGAGGGFYLGTSGLLPLGATKSPTEYQAEPTQENVTPNVAYIPMEPLIVALESDRGRIHLRFRAELEVNETYESDVRAHMPRIVDVLNGYLRAMEVSDLEDSASFVRLRSQMLRRVQTVLGRGRVNDLLIMEFVLN